MANTCCGMDEPKSWRKDADFPTPPTIVCADLSTAVLLP